MTGREKAVAAALHEIAAERKRMPMVRVERDYRFEGPDGRRSLVELFEGRTQLILYRFFFEQGVDGWPDAGCVGCSSFADGIPQLGLLHSRTICSEPSSADFGVDTWFGLNVFLRDGNDVYRTYFLQHGAMVQFIGSIWSMWSLTPYGGQSDGEDLPEGWPLAPDTFWFRRHDEFDDPPPSIAMADDGRHQPRSRSRSLLRTVASVRTWRTPDAKIVMSDASTGCEHRQRP